MPNLLDRFTRSTMVARGYRSVRVATGAGEAAALVHDGAPDGPALTLVHGWGSAGVHHVLTARSLRRSVGRLVLPDLLGHGFSSAPPDLSPAKVDHALAETLDALHGGPHVVVGSSMGGLAAVRYALARPERVRRLVLVSPFGAPMAPGELFELMRLVEGRSLRDTKAFLDRLSATPQARNWLFAPEMRRVFARPSLQALRRAAAEMPLLTEEDLGQLQMPVTVVWGEHERLLPAKHLAFWSRAPQVQVLRPRGCGHSPAFDRPAWFEAMLRRSLGVAPRSGLRRWVA